MINKRVQKPLQQAVQVPLHGLAHHIHNLTKVIQLAG